MTRKLTQKQKTFTQNLLKGMYQRDAYIDAYHPTYALSTIDANASRLASNDKVLALYDELKQKAEDATEAAIIAGYKHRSIRSIASENLTKPNIKQLDNSTEQLNKRGDTRGLHPHSRKNLKPWQPGQSGNPKGRPIRYDPYEDPRYVAWLTAQIHKIP